MKITVVALAAMGFSVVGAYAADPILFEPAPIFSPAPAYSWTGFYAGVNGGYGWGEVDTDLAILPTYDTDGWLAGVQAGYNYDLGGFVLGAEADLQWSDISYTETTLGLTSTLSVDYFGTLRARAGYAAGRFMPYVTGGLAYGEGSFEATDGVFSFEEDETYFGWTVGGGVEYAATDNLTIKAEYLYTDLGEQTYFDGLGFPINAAVNFSVVRVGANWKF